MQSTTPSNGALAQMSRTVRGRMEASDMIAQRKGFIVLTCKQMRSRFSETESNRMVALVEGLQKMDEGSPAYKTMLDQILTMSNND